MHISKKKKHNTKKILLLNNVRRSLGFPFIFFGFVFLPLIVSIAIVITEHLSFYTVIIFMGLTSLFVTSSFYIPLAIYEKYFNRKEKVSSFLPPVTIIIPAYNEETGISRTLDSLVEVDYPSKEIIVVDDGSSDNTYHIATGYKSKFPKDNNNIFSVFRKLNGGKSSAINYALRFSKNDIIIVIDADSMIGRGAIRSIVKHFNNADIVAVGGYVSIINPHTYNIFINCTALEIINSWNLMGRAFNLLGSVMIVPGALGAFRKKTLIERGIYDKDTITEDFDITIKILKSGGKIIFEESSLTYTEVPDNLKGLYNQRKRWYSGNFQTIIKHRNILTNNSYGILHKFGYPMTLLLFLFRSIWSIVVPITIVLAIISGTYLPVIVSFLMFISLSFLLSVISIIMDGHIERLKLILYSPFMVIGYAQILDFTLIKSMFDVLIHKKVKWTSAGRINQNQ